MTSVQLAMRPTRFGRIFAATLLVAAGFTAGIGATRFAPHVFGNPAAAPAIVITQPVGANSGLSPDERQERQHANAVQIPNQALSPDERDEAR